MPFQNIPPPPAPSDSGVPQAESDRGGPQVQLPKIIAFSTLARCGEEVWIENEGQVYRLRRTRQGKLILTK